MKDETIKDKRLRKERFASQPEIILPVPATLSELPRDYPKFLLKVKRLVSTSRTRAVVAASSGMTLMYWQIGKMILDRQDALKWGAKVVDRLSHDLKKAFPGMAGFSPRNLKYMRKFAEVWPDVEIVQRTVALVSWRTNISLMDKLHDAVARLWYAQKALKNGWSKEFLDICIENRLMDRHGAEPSNWAHLRNSPQSPLMWCGELDVRGYLFPPVPLSLCAVFRFDSSMESATRRSQRSLNFL